MFSQMGAAIGLLFCLYTVLFRWKALVAKYGTLSLYWWIVGVTVGVSDLLCKRGFGSLIAVSAS